MIDLSKKYKLRNGWEVLEIKHSPDNPEAFRLITCYKDGCGTALYLSHYEDGSFLSGPEAHNFDLIPIEERWRAEECGDYCYVSQFGGIECTADWRTAFDSLMWKSGSYFKPYEAIDSEIYKVFSKTLR